MQKLISLGEAFARVLEIEDRALGVGRTSNSQRFLGPTDAQITKILSQLSGVKIYGDRRRKPLGKVGDITRYPDGGSREILEIDSPIKKPYQSSKAPQLSEVSEGKAHLKLIRLLKEGKLHAWAESRVESIGQPGSVSYHRAVIPVEIWKEKQRIRKKGLDDPDMPAPIPDYSTSSLPQIANIKTGKIEEFRNIEVDGEKLGTYLEEPITPESVKGGVFRVIRTVGSKSLTSIKDLETVVQIKCAGHEVHLESSRGLAAIGLLLGQPGEPMEWQMLHTASKLFQHGAKREHAIKYRNQIDETVDWRSGNAANIDGTSDWFGDEAVLYDDNIGTVSGRITSDTTSEEVRVLERKLNALKARADRYSSIGSTKLLEEIEEIELYIAKAKNDKRRSSGPDDGHRQAIYHEMEAALTLLAFECPALAGHLGTLHKLQRRRLQTEEGQIVYNPGCEATWITQPVDM